jgi:hypothetical protein
MGKTEICEKCNRTSEEQDRIQLKGAKIKSIAIISAVFITMNAYAGWFTHKPKPTELSPAVGYVEEIKIETNTWDVCIANWKRGTRAVRNDLGDIAGICINADYSVTSNMSIGDVYYCHNTTPECTKDHVEDWPKIESTSRGVQRVTYLTIYKDGKVVSVIVEYAYPHKKITTRKTTRLEKSITVETEIKKTQHPNTKGQTLD